MALSTDDLRRLVEIVTTSQRKRAIALSKTGANIRSVSDRTRANLKTFSTAPETKKTPASA